MNVLVASASKHGSTTEIGEAIGEVLRERGHHVTVLAPEQVGEIAPYDAIVLGSAVYMGQWMDDAVDLAKHAAADPHKKPIWLFSSGPTGDPERKLVQKMGVDPQVLAKLVEQTGAREHKLFAGKLDRNEMNAGRRITLSMFRSFDGDFRDWDEIKAWANAIADQLAGGSAN